MQSVDKEPTVTQLIRQSREGEVPFDTYSELAANFSKNGALAGVISRHFDNTIKTRGLSPRTGAHLREGITEGDLGHAVSSLRKHIPYEQKALQGEHLCNFFNRVAGVSAAQITEIDHRRRHMALNRIDAQISRTAEKLVETAVLEKQIEASSRRELATTEIKVPYMSGRSFT